MNGKKFFSGAGKNVAGSSVTRTRGSFELFALNHGEGGFNFGSA